ncbi:HAD-superfamily hydrolase [Periconia macrospinosa]|uniref:HAD-superfamily hydrolase n=1 Tax=Periconia macrospinosa TaxID=97972 RepID=A0A2V1E7G9_9PLEO|nr:HAD-superfamily hydrolase [Periconia macrospinosa]
MYLTNMMALGPLRTATRLASRKYTFAFPSSASFSPSCPPPCARLPSNLNNCTASWRRSFQTESNPPRPTNQIPEFAFAFDIDGVLVRSSDPLPRAHKTLSYLQSQNIPFILLTNGGGKHESERVSDLSRKLSVSIDTSMFVQSHTPFADMHSYKDKTVMVVGGDEDKCRAVAEKYGFKTVVTPGDILAAYPDVWPFSQQLLPYYKSFTRPLPAPIDPTSPSTSLKIDAIFVYNDPRDWGLDTQIIKDVLLSQQGILGTLSPKNGDPNLPNKGYQQDGQPPLYFSNPDLLWAAKYHLPRLGQGGFREALEGVWAALTGGPQHNVSLVKTIMGKPHQPTYEFAEKRLVAHRENLLGKSSATDKSSSDLKRVYMVGDNPESDILGGNSYKSPLGTEWVSVLVQTGVYVAGTTPAHPPKQTVGDVWDAVSWAVAREGWKG